jgi:hypothetical protein
MNNNPQGPQPRAHISCLNPHRWYPVPLEEDVVLASAGHDTGELRINAACLRADGRPESRCPGPLDSHQHTMKFKPRSVQCVHTGRTLASA